MNKIIIELTEGDQARLDRLAAALDRLAEAYNVVSATSTVIDTPAPQANTEAPSASTETQEAPAPASNTPEPVKPAESRTEPPTATQYSKADVQSRVVKLCGLGLKAEVKSIVNDYAPNVSGIPADKYAEVVARLDGLTVTQ